MPREINKEFDPEYENKKQWKGEKREQERALGNDQWSIYNLRLDTQSLRR
jgi:hypothetical protein